MVTAVRVARAEFRRQTERFATLEAEQQAVTSRIAAEHTRISDLESGVTTARTQLGQERAARRTRLRAARASRTELRGEVDHLRRAQQRLTRALDSTPAPSSGGAAAPAAAPAQPGQGGWVWPVSGTMTLPFCEVRSYEACHPGLDIAAPE